MKFKALSIFTASLLLSLISSSGLAKVFPDRECQFSHYYDALERALINNTDNLYKLQQLFFRTENIRTGSTVHDRVGFQLCLYPVAGGELAGGHHVAGTETDKLEHKCWYYVWSSSLFYGVLTTGEFGTLGRLVHELAMEDRTSIHDILKDKCTLWLNYHHSSVSCGIHHQEAFYNAMTMLASWVSICMCAGSIFTVWLIRPARLVYVLLN